MTDSFLFSNNFSDQAIFSTAKMDLFLCKADPKKHLKSVFFVGFYDSQSFDAKSYMILFTTSLIRTDVLN